MHRLESTFHLSLTLLVLLASVVFGIAEEGGVPFLVVPFAIFSYLFVDRWKLVRIPLPVINLMGVGAFGLAAMEFIDLSTYKRLLAGGHLLTYLTCVFLLSAKGDRQSWWLIALSHLQFALACLVGYDPWFGLVCPFYLFLTLWTLTVFYFARAAGLTRGHLLQDAPVVDPQSFGSWQTTGAGGKRHASWRDKASAIGPRPSNESPAVSLANGRSRIQQRPQAAGTWRIITPQFVGASLFLTVCSLSLAVAVFFLTPREMFSGSSSIFGVDSPLGTAGSRTGFASSVSLGEVGEISESGNIALEVDMFNPATGATVPVAEWIEKVGPIRFRGAVMENYSNGDWEHSDGRERLVATDLLRTRLAMPGSLKQRIRMQPTGTSTLFSWGTPIHAEAPKWNGKVELHPLTQSMELNLSSSDSGLIDEDLEYTVEVVQFAMEALPSDLSGIFLGDWRRFRLVQRYLEQALQVRRGLRDPLDRWMDLQPFRQLGGEPRTKYQQALAIESFLRDSPAFTYSLSLSVDDPSIDPVLDFLVNRKRGHCEYYASALALMLRLEGIPSRLVTGYSGGEVNPKTGILEVRDLHAHAWVEAFLEDAPVDPRTQQSGPRWIVLDPTPGQRDIIVQQKAQDAVSLWPRIREGWRTLWQVSISMDRSAQHRTIYQPLRESAVEAWEQVQSVASGKSVPEIKTLLSPRKWLSLSGGIITFTLLLLVSGFVWGIRKLWGLKRRSTQRESLVAGPAVVVEFYERLTVILRRLHLVRKPQTTPLEFADSIADQLSPEVSQTPRIVTELFYNVRFGYAQLTDDQARHVSQQLDQLNQSITRILELRGKEIATTS